MIPQEESPLSFISSEEEVLEIRLVIWTYYTRLITQLTYLFLKVPYYKISQDLAKISERKLIILIKSCATVTPKHCIVCLSRCLGGVCKSMIIINQDD